MLFLVQAGMRKNCLCSSFPPPSKLVPMGPEGREVHVCLSTCQAIRNSREATGACIRPGLSYMHQRDDTRLCGWKITKQVRKRSPGQASVCSSSVCSHFPSWSSSPRWFCFCNSKLWLPQISLVVFLSPTLSIATYCKAGKKNLKRSIGNKDINWGLTEEDVTKGLSTPA